METLTIFGINFGLLLAGAIGGGCTACHLRSSLKEAAIKIGIGASAAYFSAPAAYQLCLERGWFSANAVYLYFFAFVFGIAGAALCQRIVGVALTGRWPTSPILPPDRLP